jgi:hypothetical protein
MKQLIIAGFHRSGTSATALYLRGCGLAMGNDLVGASASNPLGHGEDLEIRRFHDRLLQDNGQSWIAADPFVPYVAPARWNEIRNIVQTRVARTKVWGFKDPRVCLFLPLWRHVLPDAKILIIFRNPRDCAFSLARRHANELLAGLGNRNTHMRFFSQPDLALRMWLLHNRRLIEFAAAHPQDVIVLGLQSLLVGFPLVNQLNARWNLELAPVNPGSVLNAEFLNGAPAQTRIASEELINPVIETWSSLLALEAGTLEASGVEPRQGAKEMSKSDFKVDGDLAQLRMENELLSFEVDFLKRAARQSESKSGQNEGQAARLEARLGRILGRIQSSPFHWYFRRKKWFRKALSRHSQP